MSSFVVEALNLNLKFSYESNILFQYCTMLQINFTVIFIVISK